MTIEINRIQRLRQYTEPNGSFNTDHTGTLGDYRDTPFIEGSLAYETTEDLLNPEYAQQRKDGYPTQLVGLRSSTLSIDMNMASTGVASVSGTIQVQGAIGELLAATMGGEHLGEGTVVVTPTDADTFSVTSGQAAKGSEEGRIVGWVNANSCLEARPVLVTAGDDVNMRLAFSGTATTADVIYASATYYLTEDPNTSLQFIAEGAELHDRWLFTGLQLSSLGITAGIGTLPRASIALAGAGWQDREGTTGSISAALGVASYTQVSPTHVIGEAFLQTASTTTLPTALPVSAFTFSPAITYVPQTSHSAKTSNTIARWVRDRAAPVMSGTFTVPYEDLTYHNLRTNKTIQQLFIQFGTVAGSVVALDFPSVQIVDAKRVDAGSIASVEVSFACQIDNITAGADDSKYSAFRIAFL